MKLKVCGLRDDENIQAVLELQPDYIGFILWEPSPRFTERVPEVSIPASTKKVGVFVNAEPDYIRRMHDKFEFDFIQLHGNENPLYCAELAREGLKLIKAFGIFDRFEFSLLEHYKQSCEAFLFDTKGKLPGGNGSTFNWNLLQKYETDVPYFLSGGISPQHASFLQEAGQRLQAHAIDINSRFESAPGVKDVAKIRAFLETFRQPAALTE